MKEINKININIILILFALLTILVKFFLPYIFYSGEDDIIKSLSELRGSQYLPIIKSYSEFNFAPTYEVKELYNNKILAFPYLALLIHTLSFKLFGINSFLYIEFFATSFFLIIFYNIFRHLNFNKSISFFLTILLFIIPNVINELKFLELDFLNSISENLINLYNTRLPRPLITNLYFYTYLLIIIKIFGDSEYTPTRGFFLGLLSGISLHSFFYFAFIEITLLLFIVLLLNKGQLIQHTLNNKKFYLLFVLTNLFFLLILLINIKITSIDNLKILGFHSINFDQKLILIKSFFTYISNKYFLILFVVNSLLFFFLKKIEKNLIILYFLYIASILAFLFFILISNRSIHYYFFQHWILITGFLFFIICITKILDNIFFKSKIFHFIIFYSTLTLIIFSNYNYYKYYIKNDLERINASELVTTIKNDDYFNNKKIKILTFDSEIFTTLVLKDFSNFSLVPNSFWTTRLINDIEIDLINSFKILGLNKNDFIIFFENKILTKRIINPNTSTFFGFLYQANSLIKFNDNNNFTKEEQTRLKKTSPFLTEQLIIPETEFKRLSIKFEKTKKLKTNPDIIIINRNSYIGKKYSLNSDKYCQYFLNDTFVVYKNSLYCK